MEEVPEPRTWGLPERDETGVTGAGCRGTDVVQSTRRLGEFPELQTLNQARYKELEKATVQGKGTVQELVKILGSSQKK